MADDVWDVVICLNRVSTSLLKQTHRNAGLLYFETTVFSKREVGGCTFVTIATHMCRGLGRPKHLMGHI